MIIRVFLLGKVSEIVVNCERCITVFSFNGKSYDRVVFDGVSICGGDGIEQTDSGFKERNVYKIRIPSENQLNLKCGDRVVFENTDVFEPENAYTIMEVKDNRRGNIKHYFLIVR